MSYIDFAVKFFGVSATIAALLLWFRESTLYTSVTEHGDAQAQLIIAEISETENPEDGDLRDWLLRLLRVTFYLWGPKYTLIVGFSGLASLVVALLLERVDPFGLGSVTMPSLFFMPLISTESTVTGTFAGLAFRLLSITFVLLLIFVYLDYSRIE